jgi:site-specific DNA-methyltransferase (adenine-specific)
MKKENIEKFYDYFDQVAVLLYEKHRLSYIEGMNVAFDFLLDDEVSGNYDEEIFTLLKDEKEKIIDISFDPEEVRKAVQLGLLKGYKHTFSSNALITPDTIGMMIGYLVKKLYHNKSLESILDPLVGSGNLLYTVINYLESDIKGYGVDEDILKCNLARNLGDLMDIKNEMFHQDTLTYYDHEFDLVIMDMPFSEDETYMPFQFLNHHINSVKSGGYVVALIDNDFFDKKDSDLFKEEIEKNGYIFGLIKLSETLFKGSPKSILILRKKGDGVTKLQDFLLVDLPSFNDVESFNSVLNQMDVWFTEREDLL